MNIFIKDFKSIQEDLPKKIGPFVFDKVVERNYGNTLYFYYCNESFGGFKVVVEARSDMTEANCLCAHVLNSERNVACSVRMKYSSDISANIIGLLAGLNEEILLEY